METAPAPIPFHRPSIGAAEEAALVATLRSGWITTGPKTRAVEGTLAAFSGTAHALALNSCTAALHLALLARGIGPGDEVIVPALTFAATANVVIHTGATPVLVDVDAGTLMMDPAATERAVTPRTRALIPVHYAGGPCDMAALRAIADRHRLFLLSDSAHAFETRLEGKPLAAFADATAYSFYATKNVACGEGGALVTNDAALAERARVLALHGMSKNAWNRYTGGTPHYEIVEAGWKYNLTDLAAALLETQIGRVEEFCGKRRAIVARYDGALAGLHGIEILPRPVCDRHAHHLYPIRIAPEIGRERVAKGMMDAGIGIAIHFQALPAFAFYQKALGIRPESFPNALAAAQTLLSLPLFPDLEPADQDRVVSTLRGLIAT